MTPDQASKLRKGDRILVEMRVNKVDPTVVWASYWADIQGDMRAVFPSAIREVLPRPLEAGDRVRTGGRQKATIVATTENFAWVKWEADDEPQTWPLSDLQRVDDEDRKAKEG